MSGNNFLRGDVVTLRATVRYSSDNDGIGVGVDIEGHYQTVFIMEEHLTLVHRHFEVGERVWMSDHERFGRVLAVNGPRAWIGWENNDFSTEWLSHLEHAPLPNEQEAEKANA